MAKTFAQWQSASRKRKYFDDDDPHTGEKSVRKTCGSHHEERRKYGTVQCLELHPANHFPRLAFRKFVAVDIDAAFFDLGKIWLH